MTPEEWQAKLDQKEKDRNAPPVASVLPAVIPESTIEGVLHITDTLNPSGRAYDNTEVVRASLLELMEVRKLSMDHEKLVVLEEKLEELEGLGQETKELVEQRTHELANDAHREVGAVRSMADDAMRTAASAQQRVITLEAEVKELTFKLDKLTEAFKVHSTPS